MRVIKHLRIIHLGIPLLFALSLAGCNETEFKSTWRDREIKIDGKQDDWENLFMAIKDKDAAVGVSNDGDFLYLCLMSSKQSTLRQAMIMGFTVWFDPEGGKQKRFGIKFPAGMQKGGMPPMERADTRDSAEQQRLIDASLKEVEIIGPGQGEVVKALNFLDQGVEVDVGQIQGRFVYELKIPLAKTSAHPHAIGVRDGKPIMIGFETGKVDRSGMGRESGQGGMWSGGGRMPRGREGSWGGGKGGRGNRPDMAEPMELWVKVSLAPGNPSETTGPEKSENR